MYAGLSSVRETFFDKFKAPSVRSVSRSPDLSHVLRGGGYAKETGREVKSVSMGQGQEGPAKRLIDHGKKNGEWVLIQNCHLGQKFINSDLMNIVAALDANEKQSKEGFRLWMTSKVQQRTMRTECAT